MSTSELNNECVKEKQKDRETERGKKGLIHDHHHCHFETKGISKSMLIRSHY